MSHTSVNPPALILIDMQRGLNDIAYWGGERNNPQAEDRAGELLQCWRQRGWPLFHVRHDSTNPNSRLVPGQSGNDFMDVVTPRDGEPVIAKNVNSAFIGTDLRERLDRRGIRRVVLVGLTTDHCVSSTARMAGNLGYDTVVVSDATATFAKTGADGQVFPAQLIHDTALASLNGEFATVLSTEQLRAFFDVDYHA